MQNLITTGDIARKLKVTTQTIRERTQKNPRHPQPVKLNARVWLWDAAALEAFYSVSFE